MRFDGYPFSRPKPAVWADDTQRKGRNVGPSQRIAKGTLLAAFCDCFMTLGEEVSLPVLFEIMSRLSDQRRLAIVENAGAV
jgi:hypothetical protein